MKFTYQKEWLMMEVLEVDVEEEDEILMLMMTLWW